jgi:D-alanyl-D-alanine carboxypeptidase (penicillin-binding protein 5/6)
MRLVRRGVPVAAGFAVGAVAVFALNPMLLTMSASVQNDTLALALGLGCLELALVSLSQEARAGRAAIVGVLVGLAVLTKLTAWVLVPSLVAWLLWRHGQRALAACGALVSAVIVVSGWWFVRNLVLYGDLTAAKAVRRTGVTFAPYHVRSVGDLGHVGQEGVTYLWVPTEYLRNTISASSPVKGLVALATVAAVVAAVTSTRARSIFLSLPLLTFCAILSVATWLVTLMTYQAVAPRVAYLALPVWVLIVLAALQRLRSPMIALGGAVAFMLVLNAWALHAISRAPDPGMRITSVRSSVGSRGVSDGRDRNIILGPRAFGEACISFAGVRRGVTR